MNFISRFIAALTDGVVEIARLGKSIDEHTRAIRDQQERQQKQEQAQGELPRAPLLVKAEIHEPPDTNPDNNTYRTRQLRWERLTAIATSLAFIAAAIYAGYAKGQWTTMQNTYTQIQKQTTLMRQQVVGSQEAVLELALSYNDGSQELLVQLINHGHTNPGDIHLRVDASQRRVADGSLIGEAFHFEPPIEIIAPEKGLAKTWTMPWPLTEKERQQGGTWPPDWPGRRTFVFRADVTYNNGFDDARHQEACKQWLPGYTIRFPDGRAIGGPGSLWDCSDVKTSIASVLHQEKEAEREANNRK